MEGSQTGRRLPRPRGLTNADSEEKQEPAQSSASAASAGEQEGCPAVDAKINEESWRLALTCAAGGPRPPVRQLNPQSSLPLQLMVAASWWSNNAKAQFQVGKAIATDPSISKGSARQAQ